MITVPTENREPQLAGLWPALAGQRPTLAGFLAGLLVEKVGKRVDPEKNTKGFISAASLLSKFLIFLWFYKQIWKITKSKKWCYPGFDRVDPGTRGGGRRRGKPLLTGRYMPLNHRSPRGLVGLMTVTIFVFFFVFSDSLFPLYLVVLSTK